MVVGEGLFVTSFLTLRAVACGNAFSLRSNRTLVEASHPSLHRKMYEAWYEQEILINLEVMVVGEGFEPSKSMTADLQSAPFGRSGTPPRGNAFTGLLPCGKRGASYQMTRPCKDFLC